MKWIKEDHRYFFKHIDTCLPQDETFKDQRMKELMTIQKEYQLEVKVSGLEVKVSGLEVKVSGLSAQVNTCISH